MTIDEMRNVKREYGLTNKQVASDTGVPLGTVSKVLGGLTLSPRKSTVDALTAYFQKLRAGAAGRPDMVPKEMRARDIVPESARKAVSKQSPEERQTPSHAGSGSVISGTDDLPKDGRLFTRRERDLLPAERRYELIDGKLYELTAPDRLHQALLLKIARRLEDWTLEYTEDGQVFIAPADVVLSESPATVLQPDIFVDFGKTLIRENRFFGAPRFVAEVLSPSARGKDGILKLCRYKEAGVRECWLVDPEDRRVIAYDFAEDSGVRFYSFADQVPVRISGGECVIDFAQISKELQRFL